MKTKQPEWATRKARAIFAEYYDAMNTSAINDYKTPATKAQDAVARLAALLERADTACDWLCASHPGSDQRERGNKLRYTVSRL